MVAWNEKPKPKILTIMHQEASTPGRVGMVLEDMGYQLEACRPPLGQELPETLDHYAGAIVFGGPMSANDNDEFIKREIDWMEVPLKEKKPFFGICLGAQMLCKHLGGEVKPRPDEYSEIGYYPIRATNEGQRLMDWPSHVYQWHTEGFSLPQDATLLAQGDEYPNQAYQYGESAYGVQFHSEVTTWMMNKWTTKAAYRFVLPGAQNRAQQFSARPLHDPAVRQWLERFLQHWVGTAKDYK
ncbi:MAG: glutamine amidotransferase [Pseudomonadota bacterium]